MPPRRTAAGQLIRGLSRSGKGLCGLIIVTTALATAILAARLAPHDPLTQDISQRLMPPFWLSGSMENLLGTDLLGRDILSRIIFGSRISLFVGASSVLVAGTVGVLLGLVAGYYRGRLDAIIMRVVDTQLAIPFLVLAVAVVAVLGASLRNIIVVLGVTGWVSYGRIVRGEVLSIREKEYVDAARLVGCRDHRIMFLHILPNVSASIIVVATLQVAQMIIAEASLSFLGLGVRPPTPTWGGMVADGRNYLADAWWVSAFPGVAILLTVLGINLLSDWLRDYLDPTLKN
jgi:peptide/nickel transport system permease protein